MSCDKNSDPVVDSNKGDNPNVNNDANENGCSVAKAIDLGLSVYWASCNVGSSQPEEKGLIMGWGDPIGKCTSLDLSNYYNTFSNGSISGTEHDFVHVTWKGKWRMPTQAEFDELMKNTEWVKQSINGVEGVKILSKRNNNYIFLPTNLFLANYYQGFYWTADAGNVNYGSYFSFEFDKIDKLWINTNYTFRYRQFGIRPVRDK